MTGTVLTQAPSEKGLPSPTLFIAEDAWRKLQLYISESKIYEINGFGYISAADGDFFLESADDLFITKQVVSPGAAAATGSAFARAVYRASQDGRADALRLQWHSHVAFDAYFSPTDVNNINGFGSAGMEWFVSLVANKFGHVSARVDIFRPVHVAMPLSVVLLHTPDPDMLLAVKTDIEAHVSLEEPKVFVARPKIFGGKKDKKPVVAGTTQSPSDNDGRPPFLPPHD